MTISDAEVERVAAVLEQAPSAAYTAPLVYPWSVRNYESRPLAERPKATGPIHLYVHVPFCNYRCTFCAFAVRVGAKEREMERYVAALGRELDRAMGDASVAKLVVGGGTPSALSPELCREMLRSIFERVPAARDRAHTMEASPESIRDAHLDVLRAHGVGRVSMGIESMDEGVLDTVRRRHTSGQALEACRRIVASGLTLNIDLIYGLPGQTEESFRGDVEAVAATGVHSLCLYALRLNDGTRVRAQLAADEKLDLARSMRWRAVAARTAAESGFVQTRSYLFERADRATAHAGKKKPARPPSATPQIGIGMSARSQLGSTAYRNHDRLETYLERVEGEASPVETVFDLDTADRKTQFLAVSFGNGLPLDRAAYERAFGAPIESDYGALLTRLVDAELLVDDGGRIKLTETGMLVYDRVLLCFYPERARSWLKETERT